MAISFSLPLSDTLGRIALDAVDRDVEGAFWVKGAAERDDEGIGSFVVLPAEFLIVEELAIGFADAGCAVRGALPAGAFTEAEPVADALEIDSPLSFCMAAVVVEGGLTVVEEGLTMVGLVVRGIAVAELAATAGLASFDELSIGRDTRISSDNLLRDDDAAAVLRSGTVEDAVAVVVVGLALREAIVGSAAVVVNAVRTVGLRAVATVAVAEVEVDCALTVVRLALGTAFLVGAASASFSFPFAATIVLLLFVAFACGVGSDTFNTRSISLAKISSSSPASASSFLARVADAFAAVLVVLGVATSSARDAERVARRVGISSAFSYL